MTTDLAQRYWTTEWQNGDPGMPLAKAEPWVIEHAATLAPGSRTLDLCVGIGRHARAFAAIVHRVAAPDVAKASVTAILDAASKHGLTIGAHQAPMTDLPKAHASFDQLLSRNLPYHGQRRIVRHRFDEVARVTRPNGGFRATMLSARCPPVKQTKAKAKARDISRDTWVFDGPGDKVHPHYFCSAPDPLALMRGFWHWHNLARWPA